MRRNKRSLVLAITSLFSVLTIGLSWLARGLWLTAGGLVGLIYVLLQIARRSREAAEKALWHKFETAATRRPPGRRDPIEPGDTDGLVEQMLAQGRYALLLRPKIVPNLTAEHLGRAQAALAKSMALVPDGDVLLGQPDQEGDERDLDDDNLSMVHRRVVRVERFFLDRYPVTNREYYEFVADGGYEQMSLWDESVWAAVLDMVDQTGMPGPHWWEHGFYKDGEENHPVVGVSWYEANAYARWLGKRLPTDAEWVKAGSWPIPLSTNTPMQRRYPWGDTMDRTRANLWRPRTTGTVPVDQHAEGVSVGGVYQLIGNVWEWTSGNFRAAETLAGSLELPTPMKSIRGGAFDTYFDNQSTCQFQSGESPMGRRHNIGFRCAVSICDLVLTVHEPTDGESAGGEPTDDEPADVEPAAVGEESEAIPEEVST